MNFAAGLILIAVTVAMILLGRPANGESAPFLRVWIVGQAYALAAMVSAVIGATISIVSWPFKTPLVRRAAAGRAHSKLSARLRRLGFADHRLATQALERIEFRQIVARFARLHGDAANRAMAKAGALAGCQFFIPKMWPLRRSIPEYYHAEFDLNQILPLPARCLAGRRRGSASDMI